MAEDQCPECGQVGGPWPKGDRPASPNGMRSGCDRCGWCY